MGGEGFHLPTLARDLLAREDGAPPWWQLLQVYRRMEARGVGVHIGEWGAHNQTPHDVALAWMSDNLALFQEAGWGWALTPPTS